MSYNKWRLSPEEKQKIVESIQKDIARWNNRKRFRIYLSVSAIACVVLLLLLWKPLFSLQEKDSPQEEMIAENNNINLEDIQLVLGNNKTITFEKDADIKYEKDGNIIVDAGDKQIKASEETAEEVVLNTLIVPNGKRSNLTLADGTKVWVNSGSTLHFPTQFNTTKREIWVEGEIYIEVQENASQPFLVNTAEMIVEVLGTQFNVSAYKDDETHTVVLTEGNVNVSVQNEKSHLSPSQKISVSKGNIWLETVDVNNYISWKEGYLQFTSEPLASILKRLSRYYNIPIDCDENIASFKCNGKLVLFDNIENVLTTIYNTIPITYSVEESRIQIQKR